MGRRTYGFRIGEQEAGSDADAASQAHGTGKTTLGDIGRRYTLHEEHRGRGYGTESSAIQPVRKPGIANNALEVTADGVTRSATTTRSSCSGAAVFMGLRVAVNKLRGNVSKGTVVMVVML